MTEREKYDTLFQYLSSDTPANHETGLVVFGRKDLLISRKALEVIQRDGARWTIITGGIGKDSGDLSIPEATYLNEDLRSEAATVRVDLPPTYLDTLATNGGENSRNSLAIVENEGLNYSDGITTVAHATSSRRLAEMLKHAAQQRNLNPTVFRRSTDYYFDPSNPADQKEARGEILRLADWPQKDWLLPQPDLPEDLVEFARDIESKEQ